MKYPGIPENFSGISGEIFLRNSFFRKTPEKSSGISRNLFSHLIPLKIRKLSNQVLRISQEFLKKHSGEFPRNFLR